jgi:colicin import membrane protein
VNKQNFSKQSDSFSTALWFSLAFHSIFVSFFTLKLVFFPSEAIEYQSAIRVDLVALPDKIQNTVVTEEPPPPPTEPGKSEIKPEPEKSTEPQPEIVAKPTTPKPKDPDAINLKKSKSTQNEALDKIKKMKAIEKIKESLKSEKIEPSQLKGNVLAAGTELKGLDRLQHDAYIGQIDRHVKKHWTLPEWLMDKDLKSQVLVKFDENGQILSAQLIKSSGNPSYDELTLDAVNKSSPFPTPPEKFKDIVSIKGILLGFPE